MHATNSFVSLHANNSNESTITLPPIYVFNLLGHATVSFSVGRLKIMQMHDITLDWINAK